MADQCSARCPVLSDVNNFTKTITSINRIVSVTVTDKFISRMRRH
jgi:hypothetical protein